MSYMVIEFPISFYFTHFNWMYLRKILCLYSHKCYINDSDYIYLHGNKMDICR